MKTLLKIFGALVGLVLLAGAAVVAFIQTTPSPEAQCAHTVELVSRDPKTLSLPPALQKAATEEFAKKCDRRPSPFTGRTLPYALASRCVMGAATLDEADRCVSDPHVMASR